MATTKKTQAAPVKTRAAKPATKAASKTATKPAAKTKAPAKPIPKASRKDSGKTAQPLPLGEVTRGAGRPTQAGEIAAQALAGMQKARGAQGAKEAGVNAPAAKPVPAQVAGAAVGVPEGVAQAGEPGYAELLVQLCAEHGLSEQHARFAIEYIVDDNASAAYLRAGYKTKNSNVLGPKLLANVGIRAAVAQLRAKRGERIGFTADDALAMAADILRADTRELVDFKVGCCRFCYGAGNRYQRTTGEMERDREAHQSRIERRIERNKDYVDPGFDEQGGDGFDVRNDPNTECPACGGDGVGRVVIKDTRKISKAAAALYAGVKEGKDGIEIKFHDKSAILEKMFKHHGLYEADNKQKASELANPDVLRALAERMDEARVARRAEMAVRAEAGFTGD